MSVIKEIKPEDRKISFEFDVKPKTFLGLKVGDDFDKILNTIRFESDCILNHYPMEFSKVNVDQRTHAEFIGGNSLRTKQYVANVNEDYALVVKITESSRSTNVEATPHSSHAEMNLVLNIDYFVLGHDDNGKVFIHYLDSERSKRVRIHSMGKDEYMNDYGLTLDPLDYFIQQNPDSFNKYKGWLMESILDIMNRDDLGFTRLQGDIVFKLVEGKMGRCPTCTDVVNGSSPRHLPVLRRTAPEKMLYKVEPNLTVSMEICEDCIIALDRTREREHVTKRIGLRMGNHYLDTDKHLQFPEGRGLIEIGDTMTFTTTMLPNWNREFDISIPTREEARGWLGLRTFDSFTTEGLERESKLMTREDAERMGYVFRANDWSDTEINAFKKSIPPGMVVAWPEPVNMDTVGRMWNPEPPRMIIATGQQNVILEHKEHEPKSVYIPKDNIGIFTFQRSAPTVDVNTE